MSSQFGTFSIPDSNRTSSNFLSHVYPADGCPYKFRSSGTTGSSMFAQVFGHLCRGRRIHTSGQSDLNFERSGSVLQFYLGVSRYGVGCLSVTVGQSCKKTSTTCAAVIWDADEPFSAKTVWAPESSLTMSPRSTTLPLYFCNLGSSSAFLRWHVSISVAKWTFFLSLFVLREWPSVLLLTFPMCQAWIFSIFAHSLSTAACASGIFIAWGIGINSCTTLQRARELIRFSAMWPSWFLRRVDSKRFLADSWASTGKHTWFSFVGEWLLKTLSCHHLARHSRFQRSFEFLSCVFDGFFVLFVRIDELYPSHFSSIVELWLLDSPLSLFLCFLVVAWTVKVASRTAKTLEEVSHSITWISWILSTNLTKFDLHQHPCDRRHAFLA